MELNWTHFVEDILQKKVNHPIKKSAEIRLDLTRLGPQPNKKEKEKEKEKLKTTRKPSKRKRKQYEFENELLRQELEAKLKQAQLSTSNSISTSTASTLTSEPILNSIFTSTPTSTSKSISTSTSTSRGSKGWEYIRTKTKQYLIEIFSNQTNFNNLNKNENENNRNMKISQLAFNIEECIFNWSNDQFQKNIDEKSQETIYQEKTRDLLFNLKNNSELCHNLLFPNNHSDDQDQITIHDLVYTHDYFKIANASIKKKRKENWEKLSKQLQMNDDYSNEGLWISTSGINCHYCNQYNTCKYKKLRELDGGTKFEIFGSKAQNDLQWVDVWCQNCQSKFKYEIVGFKHQKIHIDN